MGPNETRGFDFITTPSTCGLPSNAIALTGNVTVVGPTAAGDMRIYPGDALWTGTSVLSFNVGVTRANNAMIRLPGDGSGILKVVNSSGGTAHFIFDVNGYFR